MSKMILLGTRKGTVLFDLVDADWRPRPIAHAGIPVCYAARDPRDATLWASLDHGHRGPKLSRSRDEGATWENVTSIKYPKGARYITKYLPTPDFDPVAPAAQPEYTDATVYKSGVSRLAMPVSLAGYMPVRFLVVCLSAMMAAIPGNSTGHCGTMRVVAAICLPARPRVRTAGTARRRVLTTACLNPAYIPSLLIRAIRITFSLRRPPRV